MKRYLLSLLVVIAAISYSTCALAQDKVVKKIIETGTTDNRTMQHDDHLANVIGGRIVGSAALTEAEAWVKEQFESWGLEAEWPRSIPWSRRKCFIRTTCTTSPRRSGVSLTRTITKWTSPTPFTT